MRVMLVIHSPVLCVQGGKARITAEFIDNDSARQLWFEVDEDQRKSLETKAMDAFVVGLLLPAMASGQDLDVRGPLSSKLFYNLTHYLMPILRDFITSCKIIEIRPAALSRASNERAPGVIAGFSGGVDSFCNYYDHSGNRAPEEYHITHFLFNNVGSHGQMSPEQDRSVFAQRLATLRQFPKLENKPLVAVDSNLDEVIGMKFERTHTIRNVAVALLLQPICGKFLYASGLSFRETEVRPSPLIAHLDPVILPLLGTERLECIASGGQYTRVEKTIRVAEIDASAQFLDVCVNPWMASGRLNCSGCWKCLRTELTLAVLGKLDRYDHVFDLDLYHKLEGYYLIEVLRSRDPLRREIAELIKMQGFKVPQWSRLLAAVIPWFIRSQISKFMIPFFRRLIRHSQSVSAGS